MKYLAIIFSVMLAMYSCESGKSAMKDSSSTSIDKETNDTIRIANEDLEYEIVILDIGFDRYLSTRPGRDYYSLTFLENKNLFFVMEYNRRVMDITYSRDLYPQRIEYDPKVKYGKEVNFLLYNYFKFFEYKYNQDLR